MYFYDGFPLPPWLATKLDEPLTGLYNEAIGEGETGPATPGSKEAVYDYDV